MTPPRQTFPQLSAFFYEQAEEEREHAMKMVNDLLDREANVHFGAIEEPRADSPDHVTPIRHALEQEKRVTVQINGLFEIARETRRLPERAVPAVVPRGAGRGGASMSDLLEVAERTS